MRVDDPERRRFFHHVFGNLEQDDVFQYVGMIAGVKGMTVAEHRCPGGLERNEREELEALGGFETPADLQ